MYKRDLILVAVSEEHKFAFIESIYFPLSFTVLVHILLSYIFHKVDMKIILFLDL